METDPAVTEIVVRRHLAAFIEQRGLATLLSDYDEHACFLSEDKIYQGKAEIGSFFVNFLSALPPLAVSAFSLRSLRVAGDVAYITWCAGQGVPLGTDTFVVRGGKIVAQTFAMHATH